MIRFYAYFLSLFCFFSSINAQSVLKDSVVNIVLIHPQYTVQVPFSDLANRFGVNSSLGVGTTLKFGKNFLIGGEVNFLFGENVRETDLFSNISTSSGNLISTTGIFSTFNLAQRGFVVKANFGKLIPFKKPNVNSGIMLMMGLGYMQHQIKITLNGQTTPQLNSTYLPGYDRKTGGLALSQFIGYLYMDTNRWINFFGGIEIGEAFTNSKRSLDFDKKIRDDTSRKDIQVGFKVGWIIPIYMTQTEKYYYY